MDPNLFHLDWERTLEALAGIIVLSFIVERACALLFESRWWVRNTKTPEPGSPEGEREKALLGPAIVALEAKDDAGVQKAVSGIKTEGHPLTLCAGDLDLTRSKAGSILYDARQLSDRRRSLSRVPFKELIAVALAWGICGSSGFDALAIILLGPAATTFGMILTALVIAGGSKASIKLFRDVLGIKSTAYAEVKKAREEQKDWNK